MALTLISLFLNLKSDFLLWNIETFQDELTGKSIFLTVNVLNLCHYHKTPSFFTITQDRSFVWTNLVENSVIKQFCQSVSPAAYCLHICFLYSFFTTKRIFTLITAWIFTLITAYLFLQFFTLTWRNNPLFVALSASPQ